MKTYNNANAARSSCSWSIGLVWTGEKKFFSVLKSWRDAEEHRESFQASTDFTDSHFLAFLSSKRFSHFFSCVLFSLLISVASRCCVLCFFFGFSPLKRYKISSLLSNSSSKHLPLLLFSFLLLFILSFGTFLTSSHSLPGCWAAARLSPLYVKKVVLIKH